ncbi:AAA family ATPase [Streptomyces europaeiscabiei]|uniref:AAA family ATPase n=1 Tax=Streptomyces TaxID=1883 RepID=UPI0029B88CF8|nr:AAA family ATPase [Streptomyces europaeiscabiei]MDX3715792.1 AAA family ATPase [Streptomyces europaeiscabiei]
MGEQVQSPGQAALTARLGALEDKALRGGRRSRAAAIRIANERAAPTGIRALATSTVSDWFHGRTPPDDFERLWALVEVLEEWAGAPDRTTPQGNARWLARRQLWAELWQQAQPHHDEKKDEPVAPQHRSMAHLLDFSGYLEQKRRNFSGRQWLFASVRSWVLESAERALLITGDPGVGKSAFMAELVRRTPQDELLGFHFCTAEDRGTLDPAAFVTRLSAMIADRLPAYAELLNLPQHHHLLRADAVARDPGHALDQGIIALLRQLAATVKRLILLDGLDEALSVGETRDSILTLLASRLDRFPEWIKIVMTARPNPQVLVRLGEFRVVRIDAQQTENLSDVRELVANQLSAPQWRARLEAAGMSAEDAQQRLTTDGRGNFLYVTMVLKSIELGRYGLSDLGDLPPGLAGIYQLFFERLFTCDGSYEPVRGLLEVMVAARSPLPTGILQATSGLEKSTACPRL